MERKGDEMNLLDELDIDDLDEEQQELADCLGMEVYKRFITTYAGEIINVRCPESLTRKIRNKKIISEFNGRNYNALSAKYHISNRMIRNIINEASK